MFFEKISKFTRIISSRSIVFLSLLFLFIFFSFSIALAQIPIGINNNGNLEDDSARPSLIIICKCTRWLGARLVRWSVPLIKARIPIETLIGACMLCRLNLICFTYDEGTTDWPRHYCSVVVVCSGWPVELPRDVPFTRFRFVNQSRYCIIIDNKKTKIIKRFLRRMDRSANDLTFWFECAWKNASRLYFHSLSND